MGNGAPGLTPGAGINSGTFDINPGRGPSDSGAPAATGKDPKADLPPSAASIIPGAPASSTVVEQLLVSDHSAPPAEAAHV
jgi:hypothetical protein